MTLSAPTIYGQRLRAGCRGRRGQAVAWPLVLPSGAAVVSGVKAGPQGRRVAMPQAVLRPEGRPRRLRHPAPGNSAAALAASLSGRLGGQELIQRLRRGLPAERLTGAPVESGSDGGQVIGVVAAQIGALGEVLA